MGKIDPETGEMVPTGKRGRKKKADPDTGADAGRLSDLYEKASRTAAAREQEILDLRSDIKALKEEISVLRSQNKALRNAIEKINSIIGGVL